MKRETKQRLMGVAYIAACAFLLWMAYHGTSAEEKDCSPIIILLPLGLYLIFTRKIVI